MRNVLTAGSGLAEPGIAIHRMSKLWIPEAALPIFGTERIRPHINIRTIALVVALWKAPGILVQPDSIVLQSPHFCISAV